MGGGKKEGEKEANARIAPSVRQTKKKQNGKKKHKMKKKKCEKKSGKEKVAQKMSLEIWNIIAHKREIH